MKAWSGLCLLLVVGCGHEVIDADKLNYRNGIAYKVNSEEPFTGKFVSYYDNGQKKSEGLVVKGKRVGKHVNYYENGQKSWECIYKNGEEDAASTSWYENGQKEYEMQYKDGEVEALKMWSRDGKQTLP